VAVKNIYPATTGRDHQELIAFLQQIRRKRII